MDFKFWLLVTALITTLAIANITLTMHSFKHASHEATSTVNGVGFSTNISLNVPIYVVGPSTLVRRLVGVGVNESLIRPVGLGQLASLPNGSLIIIDWSMIGPNLTISRNGLIHVNVSDVYFRLIAFLIRRGDFIIIHGNSTEAPVIEYALALAWSKAFNTGIVAIPIPRFPSGLNYIVAYGNDKILIIGPHSPASALRIANEIWTPLIMRQPATDPSGDLCWTLAQTYGIPTNQPTQVNNTYIIVYGLQTYSDSFGTFRVDFCISWAGVVDEDYNGYSVGSAELYNYINYAPNPGIYIKQLESFQDAYASYLVYQYLLGQISPSQLPGDVEVIAGGGGGYNPAYWTNPDFTPGAMQCSSSTTYTVGVAIGAISGSISYTYSCPSYMISVYGIPSTSTPLGPAAINQTWIFTPQNAQYAEDQQAYGVESDGPTYMGPAYVPQSSVYTIPAGSSAVVYRTNSCGLLNLSTLYEYIAYDINWDVWVTASGSNTSMGSSSAGYVILLPGVNSNWSSSNGFYHTTSCQFQINIGVGNQ